MVISMIVMLGMVAVLFAIVPRAEGPRTNGTSNDAAVLDTARSLLSPEWPIELPKAKQTGWTTKNATLTPAAGNVMTFSTIYGMPGGKDAVLSQAARPPQAWIEQMTLNGQADGTVVIQGVTWSRYLAPAKDRTTLVRGKAGDDFVISLSGTGSAADLAAFAGSLTPVEAKTAATPSN